MPETNPTDRSEKDHSGKARGRAAKLHPRTGLALPGQQGLLPDAIEELHATIEELRVAEEEMRAQNEELLLNRLQVEAERHRYQGLFEFAPDGSLVTTPDGIILEANHAAAALMGIAPRFLRNRLLATLVAADDLPAFSARLSALDVSPGSQRSQEWPLRLRRRPRGTFHAAVTVSPVSPLPGDTPTLRWLIRDITGRKEAEAALQAAYARERRIAETLQRVLLHTVPHDAFPQLTIATRYEAAGGEAEVGGDFLDTFAFDDGQVALVIGGVSGNGLAAATLTAEIKYALRVFLRESRWPALALARLNDFLCEARRQGDFGSDRSATLFLAVIEPNTGEVVFSTGGGEPLLVLPADGAVETIQAASSPLGLEPGVLYTDQCRALSPGDSLLLLTDGLTKACQSGGDSFGLARLTEIAAEAHTFGTLNDLGQAIFEAARLWAGGTFSDDACLLLARREQ